MTVDMVEGWAFRLAVPVIGGLVLLLIAALSWFWNRTATKLETLEQTAAKCETRIAILEAARPRDGEHVSREILDLTVKPITDRLDGIEKQMQQQTRLLGDLTIALASNRREDREWRERPGAHQGAGDR